MNRLQFCADYPHLPAATPNSDPSLRGSPVALQEEAGAKRVYLLNYLDQNEISTRLLLAGSLTRQPYMIGCDYRITGRLTNTDIVMNQTLWLRVFPALRTEHLDYIADKLDEFFGVNF